MLVLKISDTPTNFPTPKEVFDLKDLNEIINLNLSLKYTIFHKLNTLIIIYVYPKSTFKSIIIAKYYDKQNICTLTL